MSNEELEIEKLEEFVNFPLIVHTKQMEKVVYDVFKNTFGFEDFINDLNLDFDGDQVVNLSYPTTFVFGSFDKKDYFAKLVVNTLNFENNEEEEVISTANKVQKIVFLLKDILNDMDFCIVSYPVVQSWQNAEYDTRANALLSVIFTPQGNIGRIFSYRDIDEGFHDDCDHDHKKLHLQIETPSTKYMSYRKLKKATKKVDQEAYNYTKIIDDFYNLPNLGNAQESYYKITNYLKSKNCYLISTKNAFVDEIQDELLSLPMEQFILVDDKDTKGYYIDVIKDLLEESTEADIKALGNISSILKILQNSYEEEE